MKLAMIPGINIRISTLIAKASVLKITHNYSSVSLPTDKNMISPYCWRALLEDITQNCSACPQFLQLPRCSSYPWGRQPNRQRRTQQTRCWGHLGTPSPCPSRGSRSPWRRTSMGTYWVGIPTWARTSLPAGIAWTQVGCSRSWCRVSPSPWLPIGSGDEGGWDDDERSRWSSRGKTGSSWSMLPWMGICVVCPSPPAQSSKCHKALVIGHHILNICGWVFNTWDKSWVLIIQIYYIFKIRDCIQV